ncbi:PQQ-binding-like beta-propeller repeat protein [Donghicola mangrovi]|nr:PQQ-binding-like beta-propeller repeat protein [Donghicola mangrovi]
MMLCRRSALTAVLAATTFLAGCAQQEVILPGERLTLRGDVPVVQDVNRSEAISLPAAQNLTDWPQAQANARNNPGHLAVSYPLEPMFAVSIGAAEDRKHRITAQPVFVDNRVFTLDSEAVVQATAPDGRVLWRRDLTPITDATDQASGGGLAADGNILYVSSGFGKLAALDIATGRVLWDQQLEAGGTGTPTVAGDLIYFVSSDNRAWALDKANGRIRWQLNGVEGGATIVGGPAPAVTDQLVLFPFSNGDLVSAFRMGGVQRWTASVSGSRNGAALSQISSITGDPVIDGGIVYVSNHSGRVAALNVDTGERLWTAQEGALSPVAVGGGSVFLISDRNELLRLDAADGSRIWGTELPNFTARKPLKRAEVVANFGPLLVNGQLLVASSDGLMRSFDVTTGAQTGAVSVDGGAAAAPIVVNGVVYVVSRKGKLIAFR